MSLPLLQTKNNFWLFSLGRETEISTAEIKAVFAMEKINYKVIKQLEKNLILEITNEINPEILIKQLGGTVKISHLLDISTKPPEIATFLNEYITNGKLIFSVAGGRKNFGLEIKKELKLLGRSVRYVEPKNTATIFHNDLVKKGADLNIFEQQIYLTQAIQPFEEFGERDFGRPGRDDLSGMLPPKLAMIMINLSETPKDRILLDAFCGSGTIITEAVLLGYKNLIASDISEKAIVDTQKNIDWTKTATPIKVFQADARNLTTFLEEKSIDTIVSEPFLGKPMKGNETMEQLTKQTEELKAVYLGAFAEFKKILKKDGIVIFLIPRFRFKNQWITIDCQKEIENLGFNTVPLAEKYPNLLYWRSTQHVGREIWKFTSK